MSHHPQPEPLSIVSGLLVHAWHRLQPAAASRTLAVRSRLPMEP
jgi:hypothetical protein